jgi:hypothetical protein
MRHVRQGTSEAVEAKGYNFHFQITNNGGRQACSVEVMAREALARRPAVGGAIRLALP